MSKRRDDTCTGGKCPFWIKYGEHCPNYVEGQWKTPEGDIYATKDCGPKRSMILTQQLYNFMIGMRLDYANVRKATGELLQVIAGSQDVGFIEGEFDEPKQIAEDN